MTYLETATQDVDFQIDEFFLDLQKQGSGLKMMPQKSIEECPFPGLRPFKTSEQELFYGRGKQVNELVKKLEENKFVAVIGSSGTGKSSIVRAGLIPDVYGGTIAGTGSNWKVGICRPGNDPVKNLSISLSGIIANYDDHNDILQKNQEIEPLLRSSSYGLLKYYKRYLATSENENPNLLLIIDQFEELFRFDRQALKSTSPFYQNTEYDFVNLLLTALSEVDTPIYLVITMRSEFLGDCIKYIGLPEIINRSQYLVPQLTREQLAETIVGPVRRAGKEIDGELVEILVNEIENEKLKENLDQLPILQHALMRTYTYAFGKNPEKKILTVDDYVGIGGMREALANHANEIFKSLGDNAADQINDASYNGLSRKQLIAKMVFQALTDGFSDKKGGRRPVQLNTIYEILDVLHSTPNEVNDVVDHFRDHNTSFIMPPNNTALYPNLMLDISHESLMRNWGLLKSWMAEEVANAKLYQRLNERRESYETDNESFLRGSLLKDLQGWLALNNHNAAWAERYQVTEGNQTNPEIKKALFKKNVAFLALSQQKSIEEEQEQKRALLQEYKARKNKTILTLAICLALLTTGLASWAYFQKVKATSAEEKAKKSAEEAKANAKNANNLRYLAILEMKKANNANEGLTKMMEELERSKDSNIAKTKEISKLLAAAYSSRDNLSKKNDALNKAYDALNEAYSTIAVQNESIFKGLSEKERAVALKVLRPLFNTDKKKYAQVILTIKEMQDVKISAGKDPNVVLAAAYSYLQQEESNNPATAAMLQNIIDSNLFYQDVIEPNIVKKDKWQPVAFQQKGIIVPTQSGACVYNNISGRLQKGQCWESTSTGANPGILSSLRITNQFIDAQKGIIHLATTRGIYSMALNGNASETSKYSLPEAVDSTISAFDNSGTSVFLVSRAGDSILRYHYPSKKTVYQTALYQFGKIYRVNQISRIKAIPGKNLILIGYKTGSVELRDANNGILLSSLRYYGPISFLDVSVNGSGCALVSAEKQLYFFTIADNKLQPGATKDLNYSYEEATISPNGKYALLKASSRIDLYDAEKDIIKDISKNYYSDRGAQLPGEFLNDGSAVVIADQSGLKLYQLNQQNLNVHNIWSGETAPYISFEDKANYNLLTKGTDSRPPKDTTEFKDFVSDWFARLSRLPVEQIQQKLPATEIIVDELRKVTSTDNFYYLQYRITLDQYSITKELLENKSNYAKYESMLAKTISHYPARLEEGSVEQTLFDIAIDYGTLAWFNMLNKNFKMAVVNAEKGIYADSLSDISNKNLALAYLLSNRMKDAIAVYTSYKDREFWDIIHFNNKLLYNYYAKFGENDLVLFRDVFLEDLNIVIKANLISPTDERVVTIRKILSAP